jgi:hypothetical protein
MVVKLVKISPYFTDTDFQFPCSQWLTTGPILSQINTAQNLIPYYFDISFREISGKWNITTWRLLEMFWFGDKTDERVYLVTWNLYDVL